jgi:protein SCO1
VNAPAFRATGRRAFAAAILALATVMAAGPTLAHADGDPASDVLVSQSVFLPYDANLSAGQQSGLSALLEAAQKAGFPIRVAMVPSEYDLGSVGVLWDKPATYARFLGIELSLTYDQRLLVVMPNGFGFNWPHHSSAAAYKTLSRIPIGRGGAGLLDATEAAVRDLAAGEGTVISSSSARRSGTSAGAAGKSGLVDLALAFGLVLVLAVAPVVVLLRSRKRHGRETGRGPPALGRKINDLRATRRAPREPRSEDAGLGSPAARRWVMGGAAAFCVAAGVPLLLLGGLRARAGSGVVGSSAGEAPAIFPEGLRVAPNFRLLDQDGHGVSPAAFRGRPVIVTFIDPLCRHLCPLAGRMLSNAARALPAAQRPEIIAVSVDTYADTRYDLHEDFSRWDLVPQWQWAVGSPRQLAAVWKTYGAEVEVKTKHIAGTTVHFIYHSEMAFVIDAKGYERALLTWPYTAQQVDATVQRIERA